MIVDEGPTIYGDICGSIDLFLMESDYGKSALVLPITMPNSPWLWLLELGGAVLSRPGVFLFL